MLTLLAEYACTDVLEGSISFETSAVGLGAVMPRATGRRPTIRDTDTGWALRPCALPRQGWPVAGRRVALAREIAQEVKSRTHSARNDVEATGAMLHVSIRQLWQPFKLPARGKYGSGHDLRPKTRGILFQEGSA